MQNALQTSRLEKTRKRDEVAFVIERKADVEENERTAEIETPVENGNDNEVALIERESVGCAILEDDKMPKENESGVNIARKATIRLDNGLKTSYEKRPTYKTAQKI